MNMSMSVCTDSLKDLSTSFGEGAAALSAFAQTLNNRTNAPCASFGHGAQARDTAEAYAGARVQFAQLGEQMTALLQRHQDALARIARGYAQAEAENAALARPLR